MLNDFPSPVNQPTRVEDYARSGSFSIGRATVHHVTDGLGFGRRQFWFTGIDPAEWMPTLGLSDPDTLFPLNYGLFVVVADNTVTLVDSGCGPIADKIGGAYGGNGLITRLAEIGIEPGDVNHIVQTHLHSDHCGQLVTEEGAERRITFPNAKVHVHAAELSHWTGPATDDNPMAPFVRSRIEPVAAAGALTTFTSTTAIAPGVVAIPMTGHTPGHTCVLVADGGESCLLVGDIAHHPIHFRHHDWLPQIDFAPSASIASRNGLCELAIGLGAIVTAPHMPILTLGRLSRDESGEVAWTRVDPTELRGTSADR